MEWVWVLVRLCFQGVAFGAFIYLAAGLPLRTAPVVGICFALIYGEIKALTRAVEFKPYRVHIRVATPSILHDLGFDDAAQASRNWEMDFYAIRSGLFARTDSVRYSSLLRIAEQVKSVNLSKDGFFPQHPCIVFQRRSEFYELALLLPDGWEDEAKRRSLAHPSRTTMERTHTKRFASSLRACRFSMFIDICPNFGSP